MELLILRHGVAEPAGPATGHRDEPRALTEQGRSRMVAAAAGIAALGLGPEEVLTSPLVRCRQTAEVVCEALGGEPRDDARLRPGLRLGHLADLLAERPDAASVLLCGHQPDLSMLVAELTGGAVEFRKGGLAVLDLEAPRRHGALLVALYPPRALRRLAR